jgi:hypothetical protein
MTKRTTPKDFVALPYVGTGAEETPPEFGNQTGLETMSLTVYVRRARAVQEATALVPYTLRQAADVFGLIYDLACREGRQDNAIRSLSELCQRALESVAEKEGDALANMDVILRCGLDHHSEKGDQE